MIFHALEYCAACSLVDLTNCIMDKLSRNNLKLILKDDERDLKIHLTEVTKRLISIDNHLAQFENLNWSNRLHVVHKWHAQ